MSTSKMQKKFKEAEATREAKPWNFLNVSTLTKDQIRQVNKYLGSKMCKEDPEISIKDNAVIVYWDDAHQYRSHCENGAAHEIFDFYTDNKDAVHIKHKLRKAKSK